MRISEKVTFGGGDLNRAAHLRAEPNGMIKLMQNPAATALVHWQGKILFMAGDTPNLVRLPIKDSFLIQADKPPIFLGLDRSNPIFAYDIKNWQPEDISNPGNGLFDAEPVRHPDLGPNQVFIDLRQIMSGLTPIDAELAVCAKALFSWHESHGFCAKCGQESLASMAGWQRDCPACHASHFPRTDPVVIMLITFGNSVLLGRSPGWPEGMYSLLAGFVEPGETLENAVRREVLEEVGVKVGDVSYLASQPWPFPASLMVGCRGRALGQDLKIDPSEIEDAVWLSREALMDVLAGNNHAIKPARPGSIAYFLLQNWLADRLD